jgi:hypothetical protein
MEIKKLISELNKLGAEASLEEMGNSVFLIVDKAVNLSFAGKN